MKVKTTIVSLVLILTIIFNPTTAMALDVVGVAASSDFSAYLDDLEDFTEILEDEADYYTLFCSGAPETTWWQEEISGGEDNDYADNTELSLILAHSDIAGGHVQIDFGPSQPSTGPNPVRLGYESPDDYGYNIWWFINECEVFNDNDWEDWLPCLTGSHMLLGFKNKAYVAQGKFEELAHRLTGTGGEDKRTVEVAFAYTWVNANEPFDDMIARILYENESVRSYDYIDSFDRETTVDQYKYGVDWSMNDYTPPADIADLSIYSITHNSATLRWTAPGDDGNTGTATEYDIRYSKSPITSQNFDYADQVEEAPTPQSAGNTQEYTVTGLDDLTWYYFAIKTADGVPNWSSISNVPYGQTEWDSIPPAPVTDLAVGTPTTTSIPLTWHAPGDDGSTGTATEYDVRY